MKKVLFFLIIIEIIFLLTSLTSFSSASSSQIDWLRNQQNSLTGLVDSYEDDGSNVGYLYDQALAVIAFTAAGELERAKNIINRLKKIYYEEEKNPANGFLYDRHDVTNGNLIAGYKKKTGDNAWLVMALNYYEINTSDANYSQFARDLINGLLKYRDNNTRNNSYGAFEMAESTHKNIFSTENNVDVYSALNIRGIIDENYTLISYAHDLREYLTYSPGYPFAKNKTKVWLDYDEPLWNGGYYGTSDLEYYTDAQSWTLLSLGMPQNDEINFTKALRTIDYTAFNNKENVTYKGKEIQGFKMQFRDDEHYVWFDGTEAVAAAYYMLAKELNSSAAKERADYFHNQTRKAISDNGGIIYSYSNTHPFGYYLNYSKNSIAASAWFYFNDKKLNPFMPTISKYNSFVNVNGTEFILNNKPFYPVGTNNYYLWYKNFSCNSTNPPLKEGCSTEVLDDAKQLGLKVIRIWGFANGNNSGKGWDGFYLQYKPKVYNETGFRRLDKVVYEAKKRGIYLIVVLLNNWDGFGGICQYVKWCNLPNSNKCNASTNNQLEAYYHDQFYAHECTKQLYKDYADYLLNRVNIYTGIKYKDEPTIMAWELLNEGRARYDKTGSLMNSWINETSSHIKNIDPYHLITTGEDGFYKNKSSDWLHNGYDGIDFISDHKLKNIDFASYHVYPDHWGVDINYTVRWIEEHINDSRYIIGKPSYIGEMGRKKNNSDRDIFMQTWYNATERLCNNMDLFWMLADHTMYDYDWFSLYYPENSSTMNIIIRHVKNMKKCGLSLFNISLKKGWNLISIPLKPENNTVNNIFKVNYSKIFSFDNYNKKWIELGNNSKINASNGYWIDSLNKQTLAVEGYEFDNITFNLNKGWNLIGYPSLNSSLINETFNVSEINSMFMYNNSRWYSYNPNRPDYLNTLKYIYPGFGYWVDVK